MKRRMVGLLAVVAVMGLLLTWQPLSVVSTVYLPVVMRGAGGARCTVEYRTWIGLRHSVLVRCDANGQWMVTGSSLLIGCSTNVDCERVGDGAVVSGVEAGESFMLNFAYTGLLHSMTWDGVRYCNYESC